VQRGEQGWRDLIPPAYDHPNIAFGKRFKDPLPYRRVTRAGAVVLEKASDFGREIDEEVVAEVSRRPGDSPRQRVTQFMQGHALVIEWRR
jgi:hypothetical protein